MTVFLLAAIERGRYKVVKKRLRDDLLDPNQAHGGEFPLMKAAKCLDEKPRCDKSNLNRIIELLLEYGASKTINCQHYNGWTALMKVCRRSQHIDSVKLLLKNGAVEGINLQNDYGSTALMIAAQNLNGYNIVKLLLEHGADPSIRDNDNETVFDQILFQNTVKVCKLWAPYEIYPVWYQRYDLMENDLPLSSYFHLLPRELVEMIFEWI